ncbi:MAG TPA: hypothetical protein VNF47_09290 [Streptosporangiaceae bacterium]|nr:hypothetical protein [Streptosporangiaceae bacterium]
MSNFPWSDQLSSPYDGDGDSDGAIAELLAGLDLPAGATPALRPLADVLAALTASATSDELAGESAAVAVFRQRSRSRVENRQPRHRRRPVLSALLSAKTAVVAAAAVAGFGGVAMAAATGSLPQSLQGIAHSTFGAPAPTASAAGTSPGGDTRGSAPGGAGHTSTPVGPNATGAAAFGLCTAYLHASQHGTAAQRSVAFRNLAAAAGGASKIAAYCAALPQPVTLPTPHPSSSHQPAHRHSVHTPSAVPTPPAASPTAHPSPQPSRTSRS